MIKIALVFYAIAGIFKFIGTAISHLFRSKEKSQIITTSVSGSWYGICEKCGTKGCLHRFEGKRYCAKCHARLTAEKMCGTEKDKNES